MPRKSMDSDPLELLDLSQLLAAPWDFPSEDEEDEAPPEDKHEASPAPLCGARCRTRGGAPCRARVCVRWDGSWARRCRMHGGESTGPTTPEGRARSAEASRARMLARWAAIRAGRAPKGG
jgi:hypothetical protein